MRSCEVSAQDVKKNVEKRLQRVDKGVKAQLKRYSLTLPIATHLLSVGRATVCDHCQLQVAVVRSLTASIYPVRATRRRHIRHRFHK